MKSLKLLVMSVLFMATSAFAQSPQMELVTTSGDGCEGSSAMLTPDGLAFYLTFSNFDAYSENDRSDRCTVSVSISGVPGQQFTISSVDYRGRARLDDKTWGMIQSRYKFKGGQLMKPSMMMIDGPYDALYSKVDESGSAPRNWSRCGEPVVLEIETRIQVGGRGTGLLALDDMVATGAATQQQFNLSMRSCK